MITFLEFLEQGSVLSEMLKKVKGKWAFVSRKSGRVLAYYRGSGKPSEDWVRKQERRVQYFKRH